jgi:hypothetical protein
MIDLTVASRMMATVSENPVCCSGRLVYQELTKAFANQMWPNLLDNSFLVQLFREFRQVVEKSHTGSAIGAGKQLDQGSKDNIRVFLGWYISAELQYKWENGNSWSSTILKSWDDRWENAVRSKLWREWGGRFLQSSEDIQFVTTSGRRFLWRSEPIGSCSP